MAETPNKPAFNYPKSLPSQEGTAARLASIYKSHEYLVKNYESIAGLYPGQRVAITNPEVKFTHKDLRSLLGLLSRNGYPPNETLIEYIPDSGKSEPEPMVSA